jgi:hypothetical protein
MDVRFTLRSFTNNLRIHKERDQRRYSDSRGNVPRFKRSCTGFLLPVLRYRFPLLPRRCVRGSYR